jgi:hypothetical protein
VIKWFVDAHHSSSSGGAILQKIAHWLRFQMRLLACVAVSGASPGSVPKWTNETFRLVFQECAMATAIQQTIPANSAIKPWLMLGPFYQNVADQVEGLTLFETSATQNGRGLLNACVEAAKSILTSKTTESDMATYASQDMTWEFMGGKFDSSCSFKSPCPCESQVQTAVEMSHPLTPYFFSQ